MKSNPPVKPTTNTPARVVHESETQRQHVRLPLPARVAIGGKEYDIKDLSSGGVGIKDITGTYARGQRVPLGLKLPFGAFSLDIKLESEVQHYEVKNKSMGCLFVNLDSDHVSLLNHILKSFIAGDFVAAGDILNIVSRENFTKSRKQQGINAAIPDLKKQLPGLIVIAAVGIIISLFVLGNLYNSLFIVKAADAVVSGPAVELHAPLEGVFRTPLDPNLSIVEPGQILGIITATNEHGGSVEIKSPCTCYILGGNISDGAFVTSGNLISTLIPVTAKPWIMADIDPAQAEKISPNTKATITIFGTGTTYTGHVASMALGAASISGVKMVSMKIQPDQKLPIDLMNRPASVIFQMH
jgi:alginate biosynthesis protein Alg44